MTLWYPTRALLAPQRPAPYVLEAFANDSDWTVTGTGATKAANTTAGQYYPGATQSEQVICSATNNSNGSITKPIVMNLNNLQELAVWIYIEDVSRITTLSLRLASDSGFANYYQYNWTFNASSDFGGARWIVCKVSDMTIGAGSPNPAAIIRQRFVVQCVSTRNSAKVSFGMFMANAKGLPILTLGFDDAYGSQFSLIYPYMRDRGLAGTCHIPFSLIDTANRLSSGQCRQMYADGWDFANQSTSNVGWNNGLSATAGDADGVCLSQTPTGAFTLNGGLTSGGTATFGAPTYIMFRPGGNEFGKVITITGVRAGSGVTDTVLGRNGASWIAGPYDSISAISTASAFAAACKIGVAQTAATIGTGIDTCYTWMTANGLTRGALHYSYADGEWENPFGQAALASRGFKTARTTMFDASINTSGLYARIVGNPNSYTPNLLSAGQPLQRPSRVSPNTDLDALGYPTAMIAHTLDAFAEGQNFDLSIHDVKVRSADITTTATQMLWSGWRYFFDWAAAMEQANLCRIGTVSDFAKWVG